MGTESLVVVAAGSVAGTRVRRLPFVYRVVEYCWGYFDYKGKTYCVDAVTNYVSSRGNVTDPEVVAYAKALWELSR